MFLVVWAVNAAVMTLLPGWFKLAVIPLNVIMAFRLGTMLATPPEAAECGCASCTRSVAIDVRLAVDVGYGYDRALNRSRTLLDTYHTRLARKKTVLSSPPVDIPGAKPDRAQEIADAVAHPVYVVFDPDADTDMSSLDVMLRRPRRSGDESPTDLVTDLVLDLVPMTLTATQASVALAAHEDHDRERDPRQMRCIGPFDETTAAAVISFLGMADLDETVNIARAVTAP